MINIFGSIIILIMSSILIPSDSIFIITMIIGFLYLLLLQLS